MTKEEIKERISQLVDIEDDDDAAKEALAVLICEISETYQTIEDRLERMELTLRLMEETLKSIKEKGVTVSHYQL